MLPQHLTLKNEEQPNSQSKHFLPNSNLFSSRSIRFNLIESRGRQKEREHSFEDKESARNNLLPVVASRPTHRSALDQPSLSRSRKLILGDNGGNKKYQYGEEGVRVCEGVVEKYKASNYTIQRDMLQKFKREAEEFRRNRNFKGRGLNQNQSYLEPTQLPMYRSVSPKPDTNNQNFSFVQLRKEENQKKAQFERELQRRNRVIQQMQEEQQRQQKEQEARVQKEKRKKMRKERYIQRQKENLIQVGNMLREIDQRIKESSLQLTENLKELRDELSPSHKTQPLKLIKIVHNKFSEPIREADFQSVADQLLQLNNSSSCCKLPVVMYNNRYYDARSYYADTNDIPERIERDSHKNSASHLGNIVSILRKNEHRLKMLTEETEY